ncbi:MFS-type efflux pump MFS1 [Exophiala dermatitidis]
MGRISQSLEREELQMGASKPESRRLSAESHGDAKENVKQQENEMPPKSDESASSNAASQDTSPHTSGRTIVLLLGVCLSVFLVALDNTILSTAIPRIVDEFKALDRVSWYGSAYLLTNCSFQLVFGAMYSSFSIKGVLLSAILIFEVGSAVCGSAQGSVALIVGRAIAGVGAAGIFQGAFMVVAITVAPQKRPMYNGIFGAVYGISSIVAPLIGGAFTQHASWRWCFYMNLPIGALTIGAILLFLKVPGTAVKAPRTFEQLTVAVRKMDPLGLLFFLPSIVSLLLALVWGGSKYAWSNGRIIALFVVFGVLMMGFIYVEIRADKYAILRRHLLRQRNVLCGGLFAFLLAASNFMIGYYMPMWFQVVKGVSPTKSGTMSLPTMISMVLMSFVSGGMITRFGRYLPFFYLSSVLTSVGAGLISTFWVDTGHSKWIGYQVIFGSGLGLGVQLPITVVQLSCSREDIAAATSLMVFCQILGGAIFISVAQTAITQSLRHGLQQALPDIAPTLLKNLTATQLVSQVPPAQAPVVRRVFNEALRSEWHIAAGMAAGTIVAALGIKRVKFPGKKIKDEEK